MTACMVSSRRHTQSCTSWRGRLQSSANVATLLGTSSRVFDSGQGSGRAYWPKARRARWPAAEPNCMPSRTGPEREGELAQEPAEAARGVVQGVEVHGGGGMAAAPCCWASTISCSVGR